jgi:hypothetical protein
MPMAGSIVEEDLAITMMDYGFIRLELIAI